MGFAAKELEQTQYSVNVVKGGATRDVKKVNKTKVTTMKITSRVKTIMTSKTLPTNH